MSSRVLFLLIAGGFLVFASIFLIIGIIYEKIYQNNMKDCDKEVEGEVLEVTKFNFGSRLTDYFHQNISHCLPTSKHLSGLLFSFSYSSPASIILNFCNLF